MSIKQSPNTIKIDETFAVNELPLKLKNERKLARQLNSLFNDMGDFLRVEVESNGVVPTFNQFSDDMNFTLRKGYRDTATTFKSQLRKELNLGRVGSREIDASINTYINTISNPTANEIINTTNNVARKSFNKAIEDAALLGVELDNAKLAQKTSKEFNARNKKRSPTIATTEVQDMAERTKQIEAEELERKNILVKDGKKGVKMWDAFLDQKTRIEHAVVDGLRVNINEPFTVGGELLMHPGDRSLGASARNVINCRCTSQIIFV